MIASYTFDEFWSDYEKFEAGRTSRPPFFSVEQHAAAYFASEYGDSELARERFKIFWPVVFYFVTKSAGLHDPACKDSGRDSMVSTETIRKIFEYSVDHGVCDVSGFPEPEYFTYAA